MQSANRRAPNARESPDPDGPRTVILSVAIPRDTFATLQALASADTGCSVDWLASFALRDFARTYAERPEQAAAPEVHHA